LQTISEDNSNTATGRLNLTPGVDEVAVRSKRLEGRGFESLLALGSLWILTRCISWRAKVKSY